MPLFPDDGYPMISDLRLLNELSGHSEPIYRIAWSPTGAFLASVGQDHAVWLWDPSSGKGVPMLESHSNHVNDVSWAKDGNLFVTASDDKSMKIWDRRTRLCVRSLKAKYIHDIYSVDWSPNSRLIACGGTRGKKIELWDPVSGHLIKELKRETENGPINSMFWSHDGKYLAVGSDDATITIWDLSNGISYTRSLKGHSEYVTCLNWVNGDKIISSSYDCTIGIWAPFDGSPVKYLRGHESPISGVSVSYDRKLIASKSDDETVRLWHLESGEQVWQLSEPCDPNLFFPNVAFHPLKPFLVTMGNGGRDLRVWEYVLEKSTGTLRKGDKATISKSTKSEKPFDVFLCHNSKDKSEVISIANKLKINNIHVWLDQWEVRPGQLWQKVLENQIKNIKSVAVFIGENGIGPWQDEEIMAFLSQFAARNCIIIPAILASCRKRQPDLPLFLTSRHSVDFRIIDPDPVEQLIWGIKGAKRRQR